MSDTDFGLRDKPKKRKTRTKKPPKLKPLFFSHILGFIAAIAAAVSILAILFSFGAMKDGGLILMASVSSLAGAALSGAVAEIAITLKFIADKLERQDN